MVANRQRNLPKREIATAPPAAMTAAPREVTPLPTFAPLDPPRRPLRSLPPAALTATPVETPPVLPSPGDDAALARRAGDVTAVHANPAGIRPDGALPLGTDAPVPGATHEVIHVQP